MWILCRTHALGRRLPLAASRRPADKLNVNTSTLLVNCLVENIPIVDRMCPGDTEEIRHLSTSPSAPLWAMSVPLGAMSVRSGKSISAVSSVSPEYSPMNPGLPIFICHPSVAYGNGSPLSTALAHVWQLSRARSMQLARRGAVDPFFLCPKHYGKGIYSHEC
jgi:hypothetical protein